MYSNRRLFLGLSLISAFLFGGLGNATLAFACSCAEATPTEQFDNAAAVFVGTVESIFEDDGKVFVDFDVNETLKGSVDTSATVTTGWDDAICGFDFEEGKTYIVYAHGESQLSTSICSGTSLLATSPQESESNPEVPAAESSDDDDPIASLIIVALISFGAGAALVYAMERKK